MPSCKDTCDDLPVGRPATGRTPLRNLRSDDVVWLPALARTVADDTTVTDLVNDTLVHAGSAPLARPLTFRHWPDAGPWLAAHYPAWPELAAALQAAAPGLADSNYIGVALWLALTRRRFRKEQQNVIAGFLLHRAITITAAPGREVAAGDWQERYDDMEALLKAVNQVLDEQLSLRPPPRRPGKRLGAGARAGMSSSS
jgi:hypothetical protein